MSCLGVILAGGKSTRMGKDKAQLIRNKQTMLSYCQQLLTDMGIEKHVVSGQQNGGIVDIIDSAGPLAGVVSVYQQCRPSAMLIVPVDMPLLTVKLLNQLKLAGELSQKPCYYAPSMLPLYLPINSHVSYLLDHALNQFNGKGPSFKGLLKQLAAKPLPLKDHNALINTNTPEEWQHAINQLTSRSFYVESS